MADRFAATADGTAIDLATGAPVTLKLSVGAGVAEQTRWSLRCGRWHSLRHRAFGVLLDYGAVGESHRFEAWACGALWAGGTDQRERARSMASQFLRASGLTPDTGDAEVREAGGRAVVLPGDGSGYPIEVPDKPSTCGITLEGCGLALVARRADVVLADLFKSINGSRPHLLSLWGPPGTGLTTAVLGAARTARLNGFIPVSIGIVDRLADNLLSDRLLCVIGEKNQETRWSTLLRVALGSPRGHVFLRTGHEEIDALHDVGLERLSSEVLAASVRPEGLDDGLRRSVAVAARRARGLPGRFAELLGCWTASPSPARTFDQLEPAARDRTRTGGFSRVSEPAATYARGELRVPRREREPGVWPAHEDVAALGRQAAAAVVLLQAGRYASGTRELRQAIGGLARRREWERAAHAALALAAAILGRGATRDAQEVLEHAKDYADRAGSATALTDVAILSGHAWIDRARLDQAEAVVGTALAAARRGGDRPRASSARMALARCLFWKGEYAESLAAVNEAREDADPLLRIALATVAARAAIGVGDVNHAMVCSREATDLASLDLGAAGRASAFAAAAFVHLAVNDIEAAQRDAVACIAAARLSHDPLRALRARLIQAECQRRLGRRHLAMAIVKRVKRLGPSQLPLVVAARVELLRALLEPSAPPAETTARHAGRTALAALVLYATDVRPVAGFQGVTDRSMEEIVTILRACQTATDESAVLSDVCAHLRRQLHAAAVAFLVGPPSATSVVAADGARLDYAVGQRVVATGLAIDPNRLHDRIESAVPVAYGGATVGVLAARWPIGTPYDLSRVTALLTMAATAAAPIVSAIAGERSRPVEPAWGGIMGGTPVMAELRRAIARAASAPFAVLIEGESGCGKELVARAVHRSGPRRDRPFSALNCAALPEDLVEAELFGHARGAFTGAVAERAGVFESAQGGTLFLDEIGELSLRAQAKLLRVCQEGELRRMGENLSRRIDVRLVCATNRNLMEEAAAGRFRLDLLYRLDVVRISVPPLRDRREDIALLADHFWREATARVGSRAVLGAATRVALAHYDWPGNVRELQNVLASLAVRAPRRGVVLPAALPPQFGQGRALSVYRLDEARRAFEEHFVRAALVRSGGRRVRAAAELGVTRQGLTKLMTRLGIDQPRSPLCAEPAVGPEGRSRCE